jgi:hypothetical protein
MIFRCRAITRGAINCADAVPVAMFIAQAVETSGPLITERFTSWQ